MKNFEKTFKYKCSYEALKNKYFEMRLHRINEGKKDYVSQIIAVYKVDLYTLAIGPVHQSIELNNMVRKISFISIQNGKYLGKLSCDLLFSQVNQVEAKLDELTVTFNEHKDEAYKMNFDIITFQKLFESTFTSTKPTKLSA